MARRKKAEREEDEIERLQKELREEKAKTRALLKRLKKVDREYAAEIEKINQERAIEEDYQEQPGNRPRTCEHCGKGNILTTEIETRNKTLKFERCSNCDWVSGRKAQ